MFRDAEEMLTKADYVLEAVNEERHTLWGDFHGKVSWEQVQGGGIAKVSHLWKGGKEYPVCISVRADTINGRLFVFWETTSMLVDHYAIWEYIEEHAVNRENLVRKYDESDFQHIMDDIKGEDK